MSPLPDEAIPTPVEAPGRRRPPAGAVQPCRPSYRTIARRYTRPATGIAGAVLLTALLLARPLGGAGALLWLGAALLLGRVVLHRTFPYVVGLPALAGAIPVGLVVATWLSFAVALALAPVSDNAVALGGMASIWCAGLLMWRERRHLRGLRRRPPFVDLAVLCGAALFSLWLFGYTLTGDPVAGTVSIARGGWPDFGIHLAIARSYSLGQNLPPQYPFYAGPAMHYHFGFDFLAGLLERLGLSLPLAFNLPAALGMTALLSLTFHLGRALSGRLFGGFAAMLLSVLNSSWAFKDYVTLWPHTPLGFVRGWWEQSERLQTGPWNPGQEASWQFTLSALVYQRQLSSGIAADLLVVGLVLLAVHERRRLSTNQVCLLGAFLALTFPLNAVVFVVATGTSVLILLSAGRGRDAVYFGAYAAAVAAPLALLLGSGDLPTLRLGYIIRPLSPGTFLDYWWGQVGLLSLLGMAAVAVAPRRLRLPLLALWAPFVAGNTIQLSHSLSGSNHKFFNFWAVLMAVAAGVFLARLLAWRPRRAWPRTLPAVFALLLLAPSVLSGLTDLSLTRNEGHVQIIGGDREAVAWIARNTPVDAVFLTQPWLYVPPSIAGRPLYLGYIGWAADAGYDVDTRAKMVERIYRADSKALACTLLRQQGIDYVQVGPGERGGDKPLANAATWDQFTPAWESATPFGPLRYYVVRTSCQGSLI